MNQRITLRVNGQQREIEVDPRTPLLYVLRNDLKLTSPKYGCGLGQCGSCSVLIDGKAEQTCRLPVSDAQGRDIVTLEGLGKADSLHPVQQAFLDEQAAQCGYCTSGMIIHAAALLRATPNPTEAQIREGMKGVLCRCGTYSRVMRAIEKAKEVAR